MNKKIKWNKIESSDYQNLKSDQQTILQEIRFKDVNKEVIT